MIVVECNCCKIRVIVATAVTTVAVVVVVCSMVMMMVEMFPPCCWCCVGTRLLGVPCAVMELVECRVNHGTCVSCRLLLLLLLFIGALCCE